MSIRVTNNCNPTGDEIREWGYDVDLYLIEQDEDLILIGLDYVPVLLNLAEDPECPKQSYALSILEDFSRQAALYHKSNDLLGLKQILTSLQTTERSIEKWQSYSHRLLNYQETPFAVDETRAWTMAQDLLGLSRAIEIEMATDWVQQSDTWYFSLIARQRECLSIDKQAGSYVYSRYISILTGRAQGP